MLNISKAQLIIFLVDATNLYLAFIFLIVSIKMSPGNICTAVFTIRFIHKNLKLDSALLLRNKNTISLTTQYMRGPNSRISTLLRARRDGRLEEPRTTDSFTDNVKRKKRIISRISPGFERFHAKVTLVT